MKRFVLTITLVFMFAAGAYAQSAGNNGTATDLWGDYNFSEKMSGLETAKGTEDFEDDIIWGNSITLAGTTAEFTANLNRSGIRMDPDFGNKVAGGTWTLHVYKGGELSGMLFGEFTGGMVEWLRDRRGNVVAQSINATLVITGGTGAFASVGGPSTSGTMTSISNMDKTAQPIHNGSVHLYYGQ